MKNNKNRALISKVQENFFKPEDVWQELSKYLKRSPYLKFENHENSKRICSFDSES